MPTPTQGPDPSYMTTIRIKRVSHDALTVYADEHGVSYSHAANLFLLRGLLAEGLVTRDEYRAAMKRRHRPTPTKRR